MYVHLQRDHILISYPSQSGTCTFAHTGITRRSILGSDCMKIEEVCKESLKDLTQSWDRPDTDLRQAWDGQQTDPDCFLKSSWIHILKSSWGCSHEVSMKLVLGMMQFVSLKQNVRQMDRDCHFLSSCWSQKWFFKYILGFWASIFLNSMISWGWGSMWELQRGEDCNYTFKI